MPVIEIIYLSSGGLAFLASIPQITKIVSLKNTSEFYIPTWFVWLIYQSSALFYALSIKAWAYFIINILWVTFYMLMVILIIRYSNIKKQAVNLITSSMRKLIPDNII